MDKNFLNNKSCINMIKQINKNFLVTSTSTATSTSTSSSSSLESKRQEMMNKKSSPKTKEEEIFDFDFENDNKNGALFDIRCNECWSNNNEMESNYSSLSKNNMPERRNAGRMHTTTGRDNDYFSNDLKNISMIQHEIKNNNNAVDDTNNINENQQYFIPKIPYHLTQIKNHHYYSNNNPLLKSPILDSPIYNNNNNDLCSATNDQQQEQLNRWKYYFLQEQSKKYLNEARLINANTTTPFHYSLQQTRNYMMNISNMIFQGQRLLSLRDNMNMNNEHEIQHEIQQQEMPSLLDEDTECVIHHPIEKKEAKNIPIKRKNFKWNNNKGIKHEIKKEGTIKRNLRDSEQASQFSFNNVVCQDSMMNGKKNLHNIKNPMQPPPKIRICNGVKVTMIDEERKIFVIDLLNERICILIRSIAENYIENLEKTKSSSEKNTTSNNNNQQQSSSSDDNSKGWRTLYTYTKMDLPCSEIKGLAENIINHIMKSIIKIVGEIYGKKIEASNLRPRSWKEPHLLKYQKYDGVMPHTGVEMHYDGCDITWQAMLTRQDEYEGGGTYIRCLQKTIKLQLGQILVHPGELYHKGVDITYGTRYLLVCFMDGFDPEIMDDSNPNEDKEEYENNIIIV